VSDTIERDGKTWAWWELLVGSHEQTDFDGRNRVHNAPDVFLSSSDLNAWNGGGGMLPKFRRLTGPEAEAAFARPGVHRNAQEVPAMFQPENLPTKENADRKAAEPPPRPNLTEQAHSHGKPTPPLTPTQRRQADTLQAMSLEELKRLAADEEVELPRNCTKDQAVKILTQQPGPAAGR